MRYSKPLIMTLFSFVYLLYGWGADSCPNRVIFFDVEQGDSALIQVDCKNILIDGGPGDYLLSSLGKFLRIGESTIDIVILSHPHLDHMAGIIDVLNRYEVGEVWLNPVCYSSDAYSELLQFDVSYKAVNSLDLLQLENGYLKVIYPFSSSVNSLDHCSGTGFLKSIDGNINNDSVVVELDYSGSRILFMGDAEVELEGRLLEASAIGDVAVLKAGHHCSNTSSSLAFLEKVKPEVAICSLAEKNRYGHPGKETIGRFSERNIKYILLYQHDEYEVRLE